ncbi:unnamed protein product [Soboliphyme baturini]|uniref:Peroxisomal membrane protein 11C n=1 Tax=Soboliphyme baturini TaxID=241478 RepID=A0A183J4A2_9BILA|nr:unnamed protein product [Soboliphyme baturini]
MISSKLALYLVVILLLQPIPKAKAQEEILLGLEASYLIAKGLKHLFCYISSRRERKATYQRTGQLPPDEDDYEEMATALVEGFNVTIRFFDGSFSSAAMKVRSLLYPVLVLMLLNPVATVEKDTWIEIAANRARSLGKFIKNVFCYATTGHGQNSAADDVTKTDTMSK